MGKWQEWGGSKSYGSGSWWQQEKPPKKEPNILELKYDQIDLAEPENNKEPVKGEDALQEATGKTLAQTVQKAVNMSRKAINRCKKLEEDREKKNLQWQEYQRKLRLAFQKQHQQYTSDSARLEKELEQAQEAAHQAEVNLRNALEAGGTNARVQVDAMIAEEEGDPWLDFMDSMTKEGQISQEDRKIQEYLKQAAIAAARETVDNARQKLAQGMVPNLPAGADARLEKYGPSPSARQRLLADPYSLEAGHLRKDLPGAERMAFLETPKKQFQGELRTPNARMPRTPNGPSVKRPKLDGAPMTEQEGGILVPSDEEDTICQLSKHASGFGQME